MTRTATLESRASEHRSHLASRRRLLAGGATLLGLGLIGSAAAAAPAGVRSVAGGTRPTYVPMGDSRDPLAHSIAENLFWNEQMMEHAVFFTMLMPGPELARPRAEAEAFKAKFAERLAASEKVGQEGYVESNRATTAEVQRFVDFKHRMRGEQVAGRLGSLVWPTFFEHTAREGEYFVGRLSRLSAGDVELDRAS